jgi:hypothetical protein
MITDKQPLTGTYVVPQALSAAIILGMLALVPAGDQGSIPNSPSLQRAGRIVAQYHDLQGSQGVIKMAQMVLALEVSCSM